MTEDDDSDLPDFIVGGGAEKKKRKPVQTMKPPSAKRNRPVRVMPARTKKRPEKR